ncbi:VOC family protein [Rugosimonospora acidiphila]|uniref:VOC family protein n=1 Tax=Rugosimonospora acidiphila TaxID=556531 RepID=A0ABP9SGF1_9ACTN
MTDDATTTVLRRPEAAAALDPLGWRYILGIACTGVPVRSVTQAAEVAAIAGAACGDDADGHLWVDVRADRALLHLQTLALAGVTPVDVRLAAAVNAALAARGLGTSPDVGTDAPRSIQVLEIAIDALDIASIRPFWKAVLGHVDEAGASGPTDALIDARRQSPAVWFQQMDAPRPQRNRIHFDISVPQDEARHRIRAALDAGGVLVSDLEAPAFWVLADAEGNEVCVTTWQGRD